VYETGQRAAQEVEERKAFCVRNNTLHFSYRIMKIESVDADDSDDWRKREVERFANGQYVPVPWKDESWYTSISGPVELHYVHMSMDKTGMIAFTESPEKGRADIQKRMRPGRYLTEYFCLTSNDVKYWAGKVSLLSGESQEYTIAMTPDDIENVYINGPSSCMGKDADDYQSREHPVRMYGAGDLGVAYIERESSIAARVIVWPDKKIWGRVYGDGGVYRDQLKDLLTQDGYDHGLSAEHWKGARLIRVEQHDGFIAPYLDIGGGCLTDTGEYLEICYDGEIDAESESGVTNSLSSQCESCEEMYNSDNDGGNVEGESYCQSCYDEYATYCEDCETTVHRNNTVYLENVERQVCDSCVGNYPACDSCCETFSSDDLTHVSGTDESVCESCFSDDYSNCEDCGDSDKTENMQIDDDSSDVLCDSCHEARVVEGEKETAEKKTAEKRPLHYAGRDESEDQNEMIFGKIS